MVRAILNLFRFHPRALLHAVLTYPRFLGRIKPELMAGREEEVLARLRSLSSRWEPRELQVPIGKRLLVVAPHPDDEAIGAGGLLLAHKGRSEVHVLNVFNGEGGGKLLERPFEATPSYREALVAERRKELALVAADLGAASVCHLDLPDGGSLPGAEEARRLRAAVDRIRPDVVLLPWFLDAQRDHKVANLLFASACADYDCLTLGFEIWTLCQPNAFFDITDSIERKVQLVSRYATQVADTDYAGYARGLGATRGFLQGVRKKGAAAEAFFSLPNRDYCDLVRSLYGSVEALTPAGQRLR
jgi:N-acetylglucosamine malate deacetylase 1